jgi:GNAT superfamily N-acetyltransferase
VKESVVDINGHQYRYRYDPASGKTIYVGPVGSAPAISEEDFTAVMSSIQFVPAQKKEIEELQKKHGGELYVPGGSSPFFIEEAGQKVGWIDLWDWNDPWEPDNPQGDLVMNRIEVFDDFKGRGIGRRTVEYLQQQYDEIFGINMQSEGFWMKMGFVEENGDIRWRR